MFSHFSGSFPSTHHKDESVCVVLGGVSLLHYKRGYICILSSLALSLAATHLNLSNAEATLSKAQERKYFPKPA